MNRSYVHVESRAIGYLDSSPEGGTARVIVLIHAFPLAASMWVPQLSLPPDGWRLIAPDLRGFGGSPLADQETALSMDDYAVDVIGLMHELGVTGAVVGGVSMGGYVTFALLRRAPELVKGLILADTRAGADTLEARGQRRGILALLDREGPSGVAREMMPKLLGTTSRAERPEIEATVRQTIKQQSASAIRGAIIRMMDRPDAMPLLVRVTVPTLVMVGEEDEIAPETEARRIVEAVPHAELQVLPKCGHLSSLERPELFSTHLAAFVSRL